MGVEKPADTGVALFVKTPGLSPLKTRLAATIGEPAALRLYRACLRAVEQTVSSAARRWPNLRPYYAVAESAALDHPRWRRFPRLAQGEGDLGQRLASIHRQLAERHQQLMLIGVDLPWLAPAHLDQALVGLKRSEMIIGPGLDGGYYLFATRVALPESVYTQVPYSQPQTRATFVRQLAPFGAVAELAALGDLDLQQDIPELLDAAPRYPSRAQRRLQRLLRRYRPTADD